jgi:hypothetical protein
MKNTCNVALTTAQSIINNSKVTSLNKEENTKKITLLQSWLDVNDIPISNISYSPLPTSLPENPWTYNMIDTRYTDRTTQCSNMYNNCDNINSIVDSSDEDDKNDDVYSSSKSSKNKTEDNQSIFRPVTKLRTENNKSNPKIDSQDANDNPSFKRFSQMLEDLIDSYEQDLQQINRNKIKKNDSDDQEDSDIPPEYLLARQLCSDLVQEAFKLNSYSIMNLIRKETLVKLQNLIYFNIKDGLRSLNFSEVRF